MRWVLAAIGVVFLGVGPCLRAGLGQQPEERPTSRGLFGDRSLGRPVQPGTSGFGGGIQRGPSGDLLGLGRGMFPTPWRRVEGAGLPIVWGTPPYTFYPVSGPQPVVAPREQPAQAPAEQPPPPQQSTPGPDIWFRQTSPSSETSPPSETTPPVPPGSNGFYGPQKSLGWSMAGTAGSDSTGAQNSFVPSPAISARITRLAQAGGVPTSSGVQVCVQGNTAIVRGAVATPYQRSLVGNLVGLEPGVWHVDNQVTVVAAPGLAEASR